jgi:hypothetical protein
MPAPDASCPKCKADMEEGFFIDYGHSGSTRVASRSLSDENLKEEKAANTKLNTLALRKGVNTKASNVA